MGDKEAIGVSKEEGTVLLGALGPQGGLDAEIQNGISQVLNQAVESPVNEANNPETPRSDSSSVRGGGWCSSREVSRSRVRDTIRDRGRGKYSTLRVIFSSKWGR